MASPIRALPYYLHTLASMWQTDWLTDDDDDDEDKDVDIPTLAWDDKRRRIIIIKTAKTNENKIKLHATLNISPRCRRNPNRTHTHTTLPLGSLSPVFILLFLSCALCHFDRVTNTSDYFFLSATAAAVPHGPTYVHDRFTTFEWAHLQSHCSPSYSTQLANAKEKKKMVNFFLGSIDAFCRLHNVCVEIWCRAQISSEKSNSSTVDHTCIVTHWSTQ